MITKGAVGEGFQFPILCIRLDLVVPNLGIEPCKPIAEGLQLIRTETLHFALNLLDSTHIKLHYQITL